MRGGLVLVVLCAAVTAGGCGGDDVPEQLDAGRDAVLDVPAPPDLGLEDLAPPNDTPPQDMAPVPDGPACDPQSGGHVTGSLCVIDLDCACPRTCLRLRDAPASGSCWMRCDPADNDPGTGANPACLVGETCLQGAGAVGGCLPRGTLAGSFDVPMFEAPTQPASPAELGTAAVTIDVGMVYQMTFESGWGTTVTDGTSARYRLYLFPGSGATVDWNKPLVVDFAADATYAAGAVYDLAATVAQARIEYHEYTRLPDVPRDVLRSEALAGTVHLTAAGTAARAPVTGSISDGVVIEFEAELCGESTVQCP